MSGEDGSIISGPDIITRGFVYVKESEGLMDELRQVALDAVLSIDARSRHRLVGHQEARSRATCPTTFIKRPSAAP